MAHEAQKVLRAGADYVHLDVFDGNWVPGAFTFGPMVVKALRRHVPSAAFLDVHLCVTKPEQYTRELAAAGATRVNAHIEVLEDPKAYAREVRGLGMKVGLAVSPKTPIDSTLLDVAQHFDVILVMTVPPGFGGQTFMPEVVPKLVQLRYAFPWKPLEVDGGVNATTIKLAAAAGASEAVAGTAVFKSGHPGRAIRQLRDALVAGGGVVARQKVGSA